MNQMPTAYGDPSFYKLISQLHLAKRSFYPIITTDCQLIIYKQAQLTDPDITPVCKFYYAGIRKYLIGDIEHAVYDLDRRELDRMSLRLYRNDELSKKDYENIQWWLGRRPNPKIHTLDYSNDNSQIAVIANKLLGKIENQAEEYHTACIYQC